MAKQTLPPYVLQVLTSEYLVEGTVAGDTALVFPKPDAAVSSIHLTSAQVQLTRSTQVTTHTYNDYFFMPNNALAYILHMDYTQNPYYSVWKQYKIPINGVFHLGPYWVAGRLMTANPGLLWNVTPAYDVQIKSQIPGTHWGDLSAPFALVNGFEIHGWEPC